MARTRSAATASPKRYPDELLERAMQEMLRHDIRRLLVVSRNDPIRLVGYLGRTQIMDAWLRAGKDETERESGWNIFG
jgi:CBS domain-containing protein